MIVGVELSSIDVLFESKCKGNELMVGTSRRSKRKTGKTGSSVPVELWKPEFSTCDLGSQVTVVDSA